MPEEKKVMVKLKNQYCGPMGTFKKGDFISVPKKEAEQLIEGGYAQSAGSGETATAGPQENAGGGPNAHKKAIKLAQDNKIDLTKVTGTGKNGAVTVEDVQAVIDAGSSEEDDAGEEETEE